MTDDFDTLKTEKLLKALENEIEMKCSELKERKKTKTLKQIFSIGCVLVIILPVLDVWLGLSILVTLVPILVFQALSLIFLMPAILNFYGGRNYADRIG